MCSFSLFISNVSTQMIHHSCKATSFDLVGIPNRALSRSDRNEQNRSVWIVDLHDDLWLITFIVGTQDGRNLITRLIVVSCSLEAFRILLFIIVCSIVNASINSKSGQISKTENFHAFQWNDWTISMEIEFAEKTFWFLSVKTKKGVRTI